MTLTADRLSAGTFAALAAGGGGEAAIRELAAAELEKHALLLSGLVAEATERGHPQREQAREGYELLIEAARIDSVAAERVIGHPSVGAWARHALLALRGLPCLPGAEPGWMRAVGAAAAIGAGLDAEITVPATGGVVILPSLGAAATTDVGAVVRTRAVSVGTVALPDDPHSDGLGWRGLRRVRAGALDVLIDDIDPFRMPAAGDLASLRDEAWDRVLAEAWLVLAAHHPESAAEIATGIRVVVPRARPAHGAVSSSAPEVFASIAMSLPSDPVACAETLTHEMQHIKLGALIDLAPLTMPDDGRRYYAPWREDPRPLGGLLQGAYAYLGVSGFWRRQRKVRGFRERGDTAYARWREAIRISIQVLQSSGGLRQAGLDFTEGMAATLEGWDSDVILPRSLDNARHEAVEHRRRWERAHGHIPTG